MLLSRTVLFKLLRSHRRALLQAQPSLDRQFPRSLPEVFRYHSSVRNQQASQYRTILWTSSRVRCYLLGGSARRSHERGGDYVVITYLREDIHAGDDGGNGDGQACGTIQVSGPSTCVRGHVPDGQSEEHEVRDQLLHLDRSRQGDGRHEDVSPERAETASCSTCSDESGGEF